MSRAGEVVDGARLADTSPAASLLAEVRADHRSGASHVVERAAQYLEALAATAADPRDLEREILSLAEAQPEMAAFLHLADRCLAGLAAGGSAGVRDAAAAFRMGEEEARMEVGMRSTLLLRPPRRVVTLSASGMVSAALTNAAASGLSFEVVVAESRPLLEGRTLAAGIASASALPVTVVVDAALPGEVRAGDVVLVGADRVGWDGFVNKVGTLALVSAAAAAGVSVYVLTGSSRFVAERVEGVITVERSPAEVWESPPPGVSVLNRTFEPISFAGVTGVVVEDAILRPAEARERALRVSLDPRLVVRRLDALAQRRDRLRREG